MGRRLAVLIMRQCYNQGRISWRSNRHSNWCCGSCGRQQKISFFPSTHPAFPSISCRLSRNFCWYVNTTNTSRNCSCLHSSSIAVISADRASSAYDIEHTPQKKAALERERERENLIEGNKTVFERSKEWATANRYPLLFGFWVASMAGSWAIVNRNRYLSGAQKLVQARMYAQGATLTALLTSFALEGADAAKGEGRWETIKILDPNDPTHKHIIEKKIHHERYAGEDQWRGTFASNVPMVSVPFDRLGHGQ
jgi:hypothetical protein